MRLSYPLVLILLVAASAAPGAGASSREAAGVFPPPGTPGAPPPAPKRELRAVWITTVLGLDWPKSADPQEQQRSLREIVGQLHAAKFNTIFFQVRGRADAMYRSRFEPWSQQLTGTLGQDPGWDPLGFLLTEAHARGMEVHAWFNTILVRSGGGTPARSRPLHVMLQHPEWIRQIGGEYWFDPGLPEVRRYLVDVGMDLIRHYDVDGIHFDFIRYPQGSFPDEATYSRYGRGSSREDWRRENINAFVRAFHDSALAARPQLKIGSAPIGVYLNSRGMRGLQGYSELFQDSRKWIREGWQDYLAPQIYWPLKDSPPQEKTHDPDFGLLARDWTEHAAGGQIFLGIGAYKPEVAGQIPALIDSSRAAGASGNGFFRWESIAKSLGVGGRYRTWALIPPMPWKDAIAPGPPGRILLAAGAAAGGGDTLFQIRWTPPPPARDGDEPKIYAIYRSATAPINIDNPENLLALVPGTRREYTDTMRDPRRAKYFYAVTAVDRGNNESLPAVESVVLPELAGLARDISPKFSLGQPYLAPPVLFIPYEVGRSSPVIVKILDRDNREVADVVDAVQKPGSYIAAADISGLQEGTYTCLLLAGGGGEMVKKTLRIGH